MRKIILEFKPSLDPRKGDEWQLLQDGYGPPDSPDQLQMLTDLQIAQNALLKQIREQRATLQAMRQLHLAGNGVHQ